jgi:hypothetical protein
LTHFEGLWIITDGPDIDQMLASLKRPDWTKISSIENVAVRFDIQNPADPKRITESFYATIFRVERYNETGIQYKIGACTVIDPQITIKQNFHGLYNTESRCGYVLFESIY